MDPSQLMNNPQMMAIAQALMSDPEVMALMSKPGVMQKFQNAMSNPQAAMNDPDVQVLMQKVQSLQGGGGGGGMGGMGGMGGGGFPGMLGGMGAGSAGPSVRSGTGGALVHVNTNAQLQKILTEAGNSKLVVIDFYADWCGPCKAIAPTYEELARTYQAKAVFCKVNGDTAPALTKECGVSAYPTFQFFMDGTKVDEIRGADRTRLTSTITRLLPQSGKTAKPSPYKHFPLRENELVTYKSCKYDVVKKQLLKFNAQLEEEKNRALTEDELKEVDILIATLKDVYQYHNSIVTEEQYNVMDKLLGWPADRAAPGLHLLRMLVRHHKSAVLFASNITDKSKDVFGRVCGIAQESSKAVVKILACRVIVNAFSRHRLAKAVAKNYEHILDGLAPLSTHEDKKVRVAYMSVLINFAIAFSASPSDYEDGKVHMVSSLLELLSDEQDHSIFYRALVVLGTLVFRDESCADIANGLEIGSVIEAVRETHDGNNNCKETADEVLKVLQDANA